MAASVRIEDEAFGDGRYEHLGILLGSSKYDALGRMAFLWRQCTQESTYVLPESFVRCIVDPEKLIEARLAVRTDEGLRIRGTEGRIEWLAKARRNAKKGGAAFKARRQAEPRPSGPPSGPPSPSPLGRPTQEQEQEQEDLRSEGPKPFDPGDEKQVRQLASKTWRGIAESRSKLIAELGIKAMPMPLQITPATNQLGWRDLIQRIREEGALAPVVAGCVVNARSVEARQKRDLTWLSDRTFSEKAWRFARDLRVEPAAPGKVAETKTSRVPGLSAHHFTIWLGAECVGEEFVLPDGSSIATDSTTDHDALECEHWQRRSA